MIFTGNLATAGAGGGANIQTVGEFDPPAYAELKDVVFSNNHATGGGGLFIGNSTGVVENVTFDTNDVDRRGGGMLVEVSTLTLTNVTFYGNISVDSLADPKGGGGLMMLDSNITLNNATFSGNNSQVTGGDAIRSTTNSVLTINNSIFWGDTDDEILDDGSGTLTVSDSVVEGGFTGTNIITTDPLLSALADNGGFTETMAIGSGGSAYDAGNNGTCASEDQRGVSRPQGLNCDIGAFELEVNLGFTDTTVADFNAGTVGSCIVDGGIGNGALRLNIPTSTSCVFTSQIFDATEPVEWTTLASTETLPAGTTIGFEAR
ncbi:MAG: choice-of-anchor Q domain-containing protein, partial [Saprospiraceae bacterium]|nr:choice-of-anchor Q domain-containing protein [Saprospiraceae bacterium]